MVDRLSRLLFARRSVGAQASLRLEVMLKQPEGPLAQCKLARGANFRGQGSAVGTCLGGDAVTKF